MREINVGNHINSYLKKNGIRQSKLADKMNISRTILNEILSGKRKLSIEIAFKLEEFFIGKAKDWLQKQLDYDITIYKKSNKK